MRATLLYSIVALAALTKARWDQWEHRHDRGKHCHDEYGEDGLDDVDQDEIFERIRPTGNATFTQLIDHSNPNLGTFDQLYYYSIRHYAGPGSPVVIITPGEANASLFPSYLTTRRLTGTLAEQIGAAVILLEHRYWGESSPYTDLTTENMKYLTLENSIADLNNFANNVELPFDPSGSTNAHSAPWVMLGGSYSGALSAWTASVAPGTYWAYHASSAPVQAISDYWQYFVPVQQGMPNNCSKDVTLVIDYMDNVLMTGTDQEIHDLKAMFGLESIQHNDDFMMALEFGPWLWQGVYFDLNTGFFLWCDYIENAVHEKDPAKIPGPEGVGLEKALAGYARWAREYYFPDFCKDWYGYFKGGLNTECFDTHNESNPIFTDRSLSNTGLRQWNWILCDWPLGYWQIGAPENRPSIVSRLVDAKYWIRQCDLYFPPGPNGETFGLNKGRTEAQVNEYTGGWSIDNTTRLIYVNGEFDPWREASVSSDFRLGGPLESTAQVPVKIVPGGVHTTDLLTVTGKKNPAAQIVIDEVLAQLVAWVGEWPGYERRRRWRA